MSRIYEALKRAELEQPVREPSPASPDHREVSESTLPQKSEPTQEEGAALTPEQHAPSFSSLDFDAPSENLHTLLSRCQQPKWHPRGQTSLFAGEENLAYKAEVFRTLRSRLYRIRDQMSLQTLLITSTLPAEGKSFTAVNLGQAIARQYGHRALLIDADLRAPRLHTMLGAPQSPGLTEYLRGEKDEFAVIQRGPDEGFFLVPCGSPVANPVELIGNGRIKELLERVKPVFDWIILDSPPMVPVSDSSLLADICDGAVLVVKAGATPFDLAQKACADFKNTPLVGVVLNGVGRNAAYGSYYCGYYGSENESTKG